MLPKLAICLSLSLIVFSQQMLLDFVELQMKELSNKSDRGVTSKILNLTCYWCYADQSKTGSCCTSCLKP